MTYEQKLDHIIAILTAEKERRAIEYFDKSSSEWGALTFIDMEYLTKHPERYRIKPEHKLRPWKPEEVPVGAWIRARNVTPYEVAAIVSATVDEFSVCLPFGVKVFPLKYAADHIEHSTDGGKTWKPCGIEE